MVTRSDSMLPLAFVAHQFAACTKTKATEERRRVIDSIQPSQIPATTFSSASPDCLEYGESYFSLRNSISSPNNSGLRAFFIKSAATPAESLVSFGITLLLTLRKVRPLPSLDNFQMT